MTSAERTAAKAPAATRRAPDPQTVANPAGPRPTPVRRSSALMNPRSMALLQRSAGNAAVAGLVRGRSAAPTGSSSDGTAPAPESAVAPVQRLVPGTAVGSAAGSTAPPVPPVAPDPSADPRFTAVTGQVKAAGSQLKKHPPPAAEVGKAQAAAKAPPDDKAGQAKAARADAIAVAKPGGFDKAAFIAAVRKAIADAAPKNLDEADKFATSGKADGVKNQVMSQVTAGKDASTRSVKDETGKTPDASAARDKPVTPLAAEPAPTVPPANGAAAMPGPAPAEQVTFTGGPAQVDQQLADAQITDRHLTASNEPQLQAAAAAKKDAEVHAASAPAAIRADESAALGAARADAGAGTAAAMAGMARDKTGALARVAGAKTDTKTKDEVERARISGEINTIFDRTKSEVEAILGGIDGKVTAEFDKGEGAARTAFTAKHKADMDRYKDERYSGVTGAARWTADLFTGLPAEANRIYDAAKALYETRMTAVISTVADLIGRELDAAKARVDKGRAQIKSFLAAQPAALQKLAGEAAKDVAGKFDQLDADVDAKQQSLVDDLASKYTEARGRVDEEIKAEQEKNKGLVDMAKEAVGGAIDTILKLKALFSGLLARAASAFSKILEDPVAFITNFMSAVKQGFLSFAGNILTHLKKGLLGWLFGALASAGIELPDSFDLKGILKLVGSILGLTWTNIKGRIAKQTRAVGGQGDRRDREQDRDLHHPGDAGHRRAVDLDQGQARRSEVADPHADHGLRQGEDHHRRDLLGHRHAQPRGGAGQDRPGPDRRRAVDHGAGRGPDGFRRDRHRLHLRHRPRRGRGSAGQDRGRAGQGGAAGDRLPGQPAWPGRDLGQDQVDPEGRAGAHQQGPGCGDQGCAQAGRSVAQGHQGNRGEGQGQGAEWRRLTGGEAEAAGQGDGRRSRCGQPVRG